MKIVLTFVLLLIATQSFVTSNIASNERKSAQKCKEFQKLQFDDETNADGPRIQKGVKAQLEDFPHMVAIGYILDGTQDFVFTCGASLISELFILSAAHCRDSKYRTREMIARFGVLNKTDENAVERSIEKIIVHEDYNQITVENDIALMKFRKAVTFNDLVRPACLWQTQQLGTKSADASGWGATGLSKIASEVLMKTTLQILDGEQCKSEYKIPFSDNLKICAGDLNNQTDVCSGDSGGPLIVYEVENNQKVTYIIGLVSFGNPCGIFKPKIGVYTRVSSYLDWIERRVWKE